MKPTPSPFATPAPEPSKGLQASSVSEPSEAQQPTPPFDPSQIFTSPPLLPGINRPFCFALAAGVTAISLLTYFDGVPRPNPDRAAGRADCGLVAALILIAVSLPRELYGLPPAIKPPANPPADLTTPAETPSRPSLSGIPQPLCILLALVLLSGPLIGLGFAPRSLSFPLGPTTAATLAGFAPLAVAGLLLLASLPRWLFGLGTAHPAPEHFVCAVWSVFVAGTAAATLYAETRGQADQRGAGRAEALLLVAGGFFGFAVLQRPLATPADGAVDSAAVDCMPAAGVATGDGQGLVAPDVPDGIGETAAQKSAPVRGEWRLYFLEGEIIEQTAREAGAGEHVLNGVAKAKTRDCRVL